MKTEALKPTILDLSLTYHWYDMIASGQKKEEYREIKPFYRSRMLLCKQKTFCIPYHCDETCAFLQFRKYDYVRFHRGQAGRETMLVRCDGISIGKGKPEWGAHPADDVFIIKLGKIIMK